MKKTVSTILVLAFVVSIVFTGRTPVLAAQEGDFTYSVVNNEVTVEKYTGTGGNVDIPDTFEGYPVTVIGIKAFMGCSALTGIEIPITVRTFEDSSFMYCTALTGLTIPESVTYIGEYAFYGCSSLASIDLPDIEIINSWCFGACTALTEVVIPKSVKVINYCAFYQCKALTKADISSELVLLMDRAFQFCNKLTEITIPAKVTFIGEYAFAYNPKFVTAKFLGTAPTLGLRVFFMTSPDFKVYYTEEGMGFTNPWYDYEAVVMTPDTESIALNKSNLTLDKGKTFLLSVAFTPANADKDLVWQSSNTNVATVSTGGTVKAIARGTATITATTVKGAKTATCTVTVRQPVTKVTLNRYTLTIKKGSTYRLVATVYPSNANNKKVTWKSGSKSIATVSYKGLVKGIRRGTVYIYVYTVDGNKYARCRVIVK